ncbi:putative ribonuclease H-like domain-containing protein [Tanacetum coccineum]
MLADSLLPIQFWAEAVNTACYVLNRVLVTKPQMKTPYEILMGRSPNISFMRPFGCSLTILNTLDQLEAEYVAAASCCAQVLWMQNQLLDYGFNFMNTEIHIDNESTICIVRNPVFHSKTKHIQIRHHFIRDCYEQRLINVVKVHTDDNVADLLTKGFDLARFNFLVRFDDLKKKLKRLKASTAVKIRWTNADQRRPTTKKLEVKQVEFKLGEDCWEIQGNQSTYC